jgi:hypothetical protein
MSQKDVDDFGPDDYLQWAQHPMTLRFLQELLEDKRELMECWARKQFVGENSDQTNFLNARALAKVETIEEIVSNVESSVEAARKLIKERQNG